MTRLYLTGGIRLDGPRSSFADVDLPGQQGRIALAALAVERRPISHDELADIIWDGEPSGRWKSALAPIVSKIRTLLTAVGLDGSVVLGSVGGTYRLALPPDAWIDLEDAMRRLDRAEGARRHGDHASACREATVASAILRRRFLPGVDNLWADRVRRELDEAQHRCAVTLADAWIRLGDPQMAVISAERAIALDPLRELGYRLLMEAERSRGDHSAALRAFARCEATLRAEIGAAPSPETCDLAESIRG